MKITRYLAPAAILIAGLIVSACASQAGAAPAATAAPAPAATAAPAAAASTAPAAAPAADNTALAGPAESTFDASFFKTPEKPWIADSFEKVDGEKVLMGTSDKARWTNMSDSGWGGWTSRTFKISSDTAHATDGSKSLLLTMNGKIVSKGGNGACFGIGWENDGPYAAAYAKYFKDITYVLVDYYFEKDAANDMSDPFIGFSFHASGTSKDAADGAYFITRKTSGTAAVKLETFFAAGSTAIPQLTLKVFTAFKTNKKEGEGQANTDLGKKMVGKLWIDNMRFADKDGNIFPAL